jgi:hypothetical protein
MTRNEANYTGTACHLLVGVRVFKTVVNSAVSQTLRALKRMTWFGAVWGTRGGEG